MLLQRSIITLALFSILILNSGCKDETIINQYHENRPPKILLSGANYDSGAYVKSDEAQLWVLPTDPDGADDIAAVVLKISSISIVSLIVRPDDPTQECSRPYYVPMDTINVMPYLKKQTFGIDNLALGRANQGTYTSYLTYWILTEGGIGKHGDVFGQFVKPCRFGTDYLYMIEQFGLYPPALPSPRDVYVTHVELFVSGISITAYDQSGATAEVSFPNFYAVFSNSTEDQTAP